MKNIPIPSEKLYKMTLLEKVELLVKRMRWKAHLFESNDRRQSNPLHYKFKSTKTASKHKDLIAFENDLVKLMQSLAFKHSYNDFQDQMKSDIESIKKSKNNYIFADKTNNFYETDIKNYNKLLINNISKTYKKSDPTIFNTIIKEAKHTAEGYDIAERVNSFAKSNAFITLKDHKENFQSNPKCRLINPAKSDIGKFSKFFIENINTKVRDISSVNQWRDTDSVITWFESIKNKNKCLFMQYDIEELYLSISENLFKKAIDYGRSFVNISSGEEETIMHCLKSLLFNDSDIWIKKDGNKDFDVTMGSFDSAEICELVGLYILCILSTKYGKDLNDLYRDDGLGCFENISGPQTDRIRKDFINIFRKEFQLKIICESNLKIVNFLDVTLNLTTGKYKPFNKPGNIPLYINVKSNHPPNIIKNLPENILRRINKFSSDKSIFENSKYLYDSALSNSGFKDKTKFNPDYKTNISKNNKNKRKIIWFNPPHSSNVSTNIGKSFLTILDRHFPKSHKLHEILNPNNVKISYSSMSNFGSIINSHNKKIINRNISKRSAPTCNCRLKSSCRLNGNCMQSSFVYICKADTPNIIENHSHYIGLTENTFKDRF